MHRLIKPVFWTFLFLIMMLVIDQFLIQVPPLHPAHAAVSNFYQDFRGRLFELAFDEKRLEPETIEAVIEQQKKSAEKLPSEAAVQEVKTSKAKATEQQRYIYSDTNGELHFADSLDEIPELYRDQAQPMGK